MLKRRTPRVPRPKGIWRGGLDPPSLLQVWSGGTTGASSEMQHLQSQRRGL